MWCDICNYNRDALIKMIEHYETSLNQFKTLIKEKNWFQLEKTMSEAKTMRDGFYRSR
jgi:prephenate dehydrogenase